MSRLYRSLPGPTALLLIAMLGPVPGGALADEAKPDPAQLSGQAEEAYNAGRFQDCATTLERVLLVPDRDTAKLSDRNLHYYAASCWARCGQRDKALAHLQALPALGFLDADLLAKDEDLKSLATDPRWAALLAEIRARADKAFPAARTILQTVPLPAPALEGKLSVEHALALRRSVRTFTDRSLTLAEVGQLQWAAYGVTKPIPETERPALRGGLRTAPAAGALFPLEVYLVAGKVEDLPAGVYFYDSARHALGLLVRGDRRAALAAASLGQTMIADAPASIVWSAVFERNTKKYGQRGRERYVCMDLGHSGQNVYLQAAALSLGTCAVGAFEDLSLKQVIGMTKEEEPLYVMPVGHPRKESK